MVDAFGALVLKSPSTDYTDCFLDLCNLWFDNYGTQS